MKFKLSHILYSGLLVQILSIQGILTFNVFNFLGNWELKSYLHPIGLLLTITYFLLVRRPKFNLLEIVFFSYLIIFVIVLVVNSNDVEGFYLAFRDVFLIFLLIFLYSKIEIPLKLWHRILEVLKWLVIANIVFVFLTYILGPERYMELVTGRFRWPVDEEYKFKISNIYSFWRSPGLIGEAGTVGHFGLLCYFLFIQSEKYHRYRNLSLLLVLLSVVRSVYLIFLIFKVFSFLTKKKNLLKLEFIMPYILPTLFLLAIPFYFLKLLSLKSIVARVGHWFSDINVDYNLLIGGAVGKAGSAVRGKGFVSTLDSYWLLMLLSVGFVGIILAILYFVSLSRNNNYLQIILLSFFFTGFLITLTQSVGFIVLFPMLFFKTNYRKYSI